MLRVKSILRRTQGDFGGAGVAGVAEQPSETLDQEPLSRADLVVDPARYEVRRSGVLVDLTRVEFRLLLALLEAEGRVLSRDQLLDAIYGNDATNVLDRTIDVHVGRLREKLADNADDPRYIATVRGVGYRAAPAQ